jgi:ketosteroid isomerase-like protein
MMSDGSGKTVAVHHKAIEVLRRQPDGAWKLIVGDPNGREQEVDYAQGGHAQREQSTGK